MRGAVTRAAGDTPSISGHAAVFNSPYEVRYDKYIFREVIKPGAFTRSLKEKQDVRCLINHDDNQILGRTKAGTLVLSEDKSGLAYEVPELPDTTYARDVRVS